MWDTLIPPHITVPKDYPDFPLTPTWDEMTKAATSLDEGIAAYIEAEDIRHLPLALAQRVTKANKRLVAEGIDFGIDAL